MEVGCGNLIIPIWNTVLTTFFHSILEEQQKKLKGLKYLLVNFNTSQMEKSKTIYIMKTSKPSFNLAENEPILARLQYYVCYENL